MEKEDVVGSGLTDQDLCEIPGAVCIPILDRSDALDGFDPDDVEISISVKGADFNLPGFALPQFQVSAALATKYMEILCGTTLCQNESGRELSSHLSALIVSFLDRLLKLLLYKMRLIMRSLVIYWMWERMYPSKFICCWTNHGHCW